MSGSSQHGKGKHTPQSKKGKAKQRAAAMASQPRVVSQIPEPAAPPGVATPAVKVPAAVSRSAQRYSYVTAELRRIGILAGIIITILVVLALVLS
jgi:hypothetical protein